uniref:Putative ABC transporter n=1 Tax=uncultured bacterium Ad_125_H07_contig2 TaxID=1489300 RepID=A0A0B4N135_9BACT|nr:putative ABC transporter [uncultured bacterium Ad_125_H07_contig2]
MFIGNCQGFLIEFFIFSLVILKKRLKKILWRGVFRFLPVALLASAADAALLWGIRSFMDILQGKPFFSLSGWLVLMVILTALRFAFFAWKMNISEKWLFGVGSLVMGWFLHTLRSLSPRVFHTPEGESKVEAAYESAVVLQSNGGVFFQAVQAVLQLLVFLPVLFYISWPLTLFLFVVVVPLVGWMQRRLHKMGPAEEHILTERSDFRGSLYLARKLFRRWSSRFERKEISNDLMARVRNLRDDGLEVSLRKGVLSLITETVSVLAMVFVLAFCALLISEGWMNGTGLVLYCSAVLLCYKPVKECARVMPQARSAMSALSVLEKFETLPSKKSDSSSAEKTCSPNSDNLQITHGDFAYEGAFETLFSNFSLCWNTKKPVLVRGRNGVGKSTLLRLIAGLEEWDYGKILSSISLKNNVFFVAQDLELPPIHLLQKLLAQTNSVAVIEFAHAARVDKIIAKEGMSGGERARVALAWALASDSSMILLDEPFASVALADRELLLTAFLDTAELLHKWVVLVSHDVLSRELEQRFNVVEMGDA